VFFTKVLDEVFWLKSGGGLLGFCADFIIVESVTPSESGCTADDSNVVINVVIEVGPEVQ